MTDRGIGGIFTGRLVDRIAPCWMITFGACLMAAGLFATTIVRGRARRGAGCETCLGADS